MKKLILVSLFLSVFIGCNSSIVDDPSTIIPYSIPENGRVKITVENSYNTVIAFLIDEEQRAGSYSVPFDASNLAEGIYFYIIEITGENEYYKKITKHLLLIK